MEDTVYCRYCKPRHPKQSEINRAKAKFAFSYAKPSQPCTISARRFLFLELKDKLNSLSWISSAEKLLGPSIALMNPFINAALKNT